MPALAAEAAAAPSATLSTDACVVRSKQAADGRRE